jgi:dimethylamine monooxygenase subunit A
MAFPLDALARTVVTVAVDQPPAWLDEIDPAPGPPFLRMGTRALARGDWLLGGPDVPGQLAEKRRVLAAHHASAVIAPPEVDAAAAELLDAVGGTRDELHPLDAAGRLVAEDLCLLTQDGGGDGGDGHRGWLLAGGSVCFPSHWRLADKVGRPVAEVHEPVPRYAAELASRVDRFLDRLRPERPAWRRNWTVHQSPDLFVPEAPPPPEPPVTGADAGDRLWLRSERQTLLRLGRSGAIVFGIRTQQVPLRVVAGRPDLCRRLAAALASWPDELVAYRGGEALRRPLLAWLGAASAATGTATGTAER